jgi:hypothetical protein
MLSFTVLLVFCLPSFAHVQLLSPDGGENLDVGSVVTIEWKILIAHNLQNWDIWYSTTGAGGPWIEVAMDLPPGDPSAGSVHNYDWTVPEDVSNQVRVRVRQDNSGTDYYDVSNGDLSIRYLALDADPNPVSGGQTLTLTTRAASLPGSVTALFLVDVSGVPVFLFIGYVNLNAQGQWSLSATVPPGYAGEDLTFRTYAKRPPGFLVWTNDAKVLLQ